MDNIAAINLGQLSRIFDHAPVRILATQLDDLNAAASQAYVDSVNRWAMWLAMAGVESVQFTRFEEDLNYSSEALLRTWPRHFDARTAAVYARNPEKIANRVYSDRMGNGDEQSGDGWKFRGRGVGQLTGYDNYRNATKALGLDLISDPSQASTSARFLTFSWFWLANGLNRWADKRDVGGCTRVLNGGQLGLNARNDLWTRAQAILGGETP